MNRLQELESLIIKHKSLYYLGTPEISDTDYDQIEEELKSLDPLNPVLKIVGAKVENTEKVSHEHKMLSLDKTYSIADLEKWVLENESIAMQKIDGVSCSLIYEQGKLVLAKTRGDGSFGEDITDKVLWVPCVPKTIPIKSTDENRIEVRGELFCYEENFIHLAKEMEGLGLERPTSLRNIVAGLIGRKDYIYLSKHLSFLGFDVLGKKFKKEEEKFHFLKEKRIETPEIFKCSSKQKINELIKSSEDFMAVGDYQIDGIVFVYNDIEMQNGLGETAHHPRYKLAFKFQGETKPARIESISWSVSRNGVLTPVANIEPIELSGAMISRVTLHNYGIVNIHSLKTDDIIEIVRSGEVIPKFLRVIEPSSNKVVFPTECPSCAEKVIIEDIRLLCVNEACPVKIKESILYFIQKIGIDDLSSKRLEEMIKCNLVKKISDLYELREEDFLTLEKVKEKLAKKFYKNIQASKNSNLITFLTSLGISGGGYNKCEKIVQAGYSTIEKIKSLTELELQQIDSFAEKSSLEFVNSLQTKLTIIDELIAKGFKFDVNKVVQGSITGKKICITGSLSIKRSEMEGMIREEGGLIVASVTKNTDYLLTNDKDSGSSKNKKANLLNIPIVNEEDFAEILNSK